MNPELLREMVRGSRYFLIALLVVALLDAALYGYRTLSQEPELEKMQAAYFSTRAAGGDRASDRTVAYQSSQRDLAIFQERLIPKRDFARFLEDLFALAEKRSLQLKTIGYRPGTDKGPIVSYGIALTVTGTYPALKGLIGDLSRYPQMVTLNTVSLRSTSNTEKVVDLQIQMTAFLKTEGA
ncbi:type 4a pilus biogenesis protein PilO [Geomonas sp. RF6]|uniref:type 4a pilus biogenesis protein PilO n=1 Tax=Geomonas sp. RF6 TaxID=2897342 RepID=UPI001E5B920B|nr:type 4a pilus biogenesis protein PilO [Geomonas sp. RF6]UFS70871.1 type 4a pilus biogenesis protein PilO [Geomonas sp. RF6]